MQCNNCGNSVDPQLKSCPYCGVPLIIPSASIDRASIWIGVLSFLIPLLGLILFIVKRESTPKAAKTYGLCGLFGFIAAILLSAVLPVLATYVYYLSYR